MTTPSSGPLADLLVTSALSLSNETDLEEFVEAERVLHQRILNTYAEGQEAGLQFEPQASFRAAEERLRTRPRARALARRWALGLMKNRRPAAAAGGRSSWRYAIAVPLLVSGAVPAVQDLLERFSSVFGRALEDNGFEAVETLARPSPLVTSAGLRTLSSEDVLSLFCGELTNDAPVLAAGGVQLLYFMLTAQRIPRRPDEDGGDQFVALAAAALGGLPEGLQVQIGSPVFPGFAANPTITPAYGEFVESAVREALAGLPDAHRAVVVVRTHASGYVELVIQSPEVPQGVPIAAPEVYCEPASYVLEFCGVAAVNAGALVRCEDAGEWNGAPATLQ